jgi:hypothetical protein
VKRAIIAIGGDLEKALQSYASRQEVAPGFTALATEHNQRSRA